MRNYCGFCRCEFTGHECETLCPECKDEIVAMEKTIDHIRTIRALEERERLGIERVQRKYFVNYIEV